MFAPLTVLVRKMPKRISGSGWRSSHATNPSSSTAAAAKTDDRLAGEPPGLARLRDRVDHRGQPAGHEHRSADVEGRRPRVTALGQQTRCREQCGEADRR